MEKINKRRSYHKPQETVVQNPLYGKKNPIVSLYYSRSILIFLFLSWFIFNHLLTAETNEKQKAINLHRPSPYFEY